VAFNPETVRRMLEETRYHERGFAVVLDDAIGITQTLNHWRNAALDPIRSWLSKTERWLTKLMPPRPWDKAGT
jgi:hypothetical protein